MSLLKIWEYVKYQKKDVLPRGINFGSPPLPSPHTQ